MGGKLVGLVGGWWKETIEEHCLTSPDFSTSFSFSRHPCVETSSYNQNFPMD